MIATERVVTGALESRSSGALVGTQQRRILCATDLSTRSVGALRAAAALVERLDGQLVLLHVLAKRAPGGAEMLARGQLREQLHSAGLVLESAPVLAVREGDPAKTIAAVAREVRADLIVLGAQRKRALAALTGTTAERVASSTRSPVLIVRSDGTLRYDRVVVAADLSPALEDVLRVADHWNFLDRASVSIVHGFQSPYQGPRYAEGYDVASARKYIARWKKIARAQLLSKVTAAGLDATRFEMRIEEKRPLRVVRRALRFATPSLLVLGSSGHTFMSRMVRGSLANDALLSLDCDVLMCGAKGPRRMLH